MPAPDRQIPGGRPRLSNDDRAANFFSAAPREHEARAPAATVGASLPKFLLSIPRERRIQHLVACLSLESRCAPVCSALRSTTKVAACNIIHVKPESRNRMVKFGISRARVKAAISTGSEYQPLN